MNLVNGYETLLMANDALLSMMEKDYGMLDEFPEYYGGDTSVDAR